MHEDKITNVGIEIALKAVRHELDPNKVRDSVERKVAELEKLKLIAVERATKNAADYAMASKTGKSTWMRPPETPEKILECFEKRCQYERMHYATVRVMELPQKGQRFILAYGPEFTLIGTGPFETYEEACDWFYLGGR